MTSIPNVAVDTKANVYFDGKVVSHTIHLNDGTKKTLGLIFPGKYHFGTAMAERMEVTSGSCQIVLDYTDEVRVIDAGSAFDVPGNSGFTIEVDDGICEYVCSFIVW